jgi:CRP/FNR family transcriptional regulator, anaerobic regulatory protein
VDILLPGDIVGMENAVMGRSNHEIIAASSFGYRLLTGPTLIELMSNPAVSLRALALVGETLWRLDQHLTAVMRFDARGRICLFLLGIYDRLRRRNLVARPTFNLPLTQEQMADHLGMTIVHIGRTLRRLREEELVLVDRQVVIILDLDQLRRSVGDAPSFAFPETENVGQSAEPIQPAE